MNYLVKFIDKHKSKVKENKWAVLSWAGLGLAIVAVVVYTLLTRRSAADIKHALDVSKEEVNQIKLSNELDKLEGIVEDASLVIADNQDETDKIRSDMEEEAQKHADIKDQLDSIKSFKDLNSRVRFADDSDE